MAKPKQKKDGEWQAPFLPALSTLQDRPEIVLHVSKYRHNAKTTFKDENLCFDIINHKLANRGVKWIARTCGVSAHTVRAVMVEAEKRGILAPLKERLSGKYAAILEDSADEMHERILSGTVPDNVLPVMHGIVADKKAALDGQAGLIVEHRIAPVLNVDAVNEFFARMPVTDVESVVLSGNGPENIQGQLRTSVRTSLAPSSEQGGGGDQARAGEGESGVVSPSGEFQAKESSES